ncbi:MAG: HlyD family efflux transporter periplasmic adaptor subunit [Firmicutes bacterium]|nr:HlyD family efflux transporter periplasmic adaptor subunit [Bacillota bacterium]
MKKNGVFLIIFIGVVLVGLFWLRSRPAPGRDTDTTVALEEQPPAVDERPLIEAFGLVEAAQVTNINIEFPARVRRFYVKEGEKVSLGQVLLALDVEEYYSEIRNTEYELQTTLYELNTVQSEAAELAAKIAVKEEELATENAYELRQISSDLAKAHQDFDKKKELLAIKAVPASEVTELEKAVADLTRSYQQLRREKEEEIKRLRSELSLLKGGSGPEVTRINMLKQKIVLLEEKLAMLGNKLDQNFIRDNKVIAPTGNAVVYEIGYAEGDLITAERKVLSLISLDSLVVKANIAEEFIKDLRLGAEAVITPVADYNRTYHGKVIRRSQVAIKDSGETVVPVEISIEDRDEFLLPNFNVDVKIYIN